MSAAEPFPVPRVRRMSEADLDQVLYIENASFSTPWSRATFEELLARGDADLWVASIAESIVGYAVVWYAADESELGNLAVAPDWRRRGIGRLLLDWSLEGAVRRGVEHMFLEVRVGNRGAQALYESRGFESVGLRRRYYRAPTEDARVLRLELPGRS